ncbi:YegS/Rv2252/BmrU family lipid kinase [Bacteroidales bacterium OttesenSCG-928-B11]|nr:YegS/Rv2252/BmrU family lipid kinase [Bacteroidales bacterium OttesenSCG-928-C03]MDL2312797.1 YegS/Rv2252/BmrU family lipid kinase [Bacteroidales bacterium OttesenSCG-928-B11]MDL2325881.1 YegS/Rv2252/BmrU family lipid kinase [Bacteroidales bacterium OttesenSCG-928-A14]
MSIAIADVRKCHWQVILNPNALGGKCSQYWQIISEQLANRGIPFTEHLANHTGAGSMISRSLCRQGERHFIILGGDGTLNEVVNGVATSGMDTTEVFIVPFPIGTGNDWARTHNYPQDYLDVFPSFLAGHFFKHDIGLVKSMQDDEVVDERYFINIAGFCFDAAVINEVTKRKKKFIPAGVYLACLLKVLLTYKAKPTVIATTTETLSDSVFTIAVGICKYNGNGMMQVPMGDPADGMFDIVTIRKIPLLKVLANVGNLFKGEHIRLKEVTVMRSDEVRISSGHLTLGEVEGEMLTAGDYHVKCFRQAINMLKIKES